MTVRAGTSVTWGEEIAEEAVGRRVVRTYRPRPTSIDDVLRTALAVDPDRILLVQGDRRWSAADLEGSAARMAARLGAAGTGPGDRVLLLSRNSQDWVAAYFGIIRAGAVAVLGNSWWTGDDVAAAVATAPVRCAVVDGPSAPAVPDGIPLLPVTAGADGVATAVTRPPTRAEDDPGVVVFTSGTTSRPRAAQLSHRSVIANLHNLLVRTGQRPGATGRPPSVTLCTFPLFHISGMQSVLNSLVTGGRLVFLSDRFDAAAVLELIEREGVTTWPAVPTMVAMVLDHPDLHRRDTSSLVSLAVGGAPVPPLLRERAADALPTVQRRTGESYGSTEAGGTVATTTYDRESRTVGPRPVPTVDVRIDAADRDEGEILVRSASVMDGYLGVDPGEQPVDDDGWLRTGDLGRVDQHGILHITGRANDIIIRGGENVAPSHVEAALLELDGVMAAAVVGTPHPIWGEEVAAVIRHVAGAPLCADDLVIAARVMLPSYAVPTRWAFTTEPLPLTDTGKVHRAALAGYFR